MSSNPLHNFSTIQNLFSRDNSATLYRQVIVLAGDEKWQKASLKTILSGFESDVLWVSENDPKDFQFVTFKKVTSWLGREKEVVIFDANECFDPDSFAAVSGIVIGGGVFFLLLPNIAKWNDIYRTLFGKRLTQSILNTPDVVVIEENCIEFKLPDSLIPTTPIEGIDPPFITFDQQQIVENIERNVISGKPVPVVIAADRGRGKSAALGIAAARLINSGVKNIVVTAPRLRATDIFFKHILDILPEAESSRGCIKFNHSVIQFYSPDQLIHEDIKADILLVDEAAAIPVPLLSLFLEKYPQCVFSTTVHGYEGTGRGFFLRFFKELNKYNSGWLNLKMETPVRWAEGDPLEKWMFNLLCLGADIVDFKNISIKLNYIEYKVLTKDQLINDEGILDHVFSLLVLAHYKTKPSDLQKLLDDEALSLYVAVQDKQILAVALVVQEGLFSTSLSTAVYRGERRPMGHLLAQSLTYHCGVKHAATLDYARIMRIVVHPELQSQGIGTNLLDFIVSNEKTKGRDAIGTSFGMTEYLLAFWKKLHFDVVRIGFTREQTSGEHAAIMLLAFTDKGKKIHEQVEIRFRTQIYFLLKDILSDLSLEVRNILQTEDIYSDELTEYEIQDLDSFIKYSRNYELCISCLNKFVVSKQEIIQKENFPIIFRRVLLEKVIKKMSWKKLAKSLALTGQNEARVLFKQAVHYLKNNQDGL